MAINGFVFYTFEQYALGESFYDNFNGLLTGYEGDVETFESGQEYYDQSIEETTTDDLEDGEMNGTVALMDEVALAESVESPEGYATTLWEYAPDELGPRINDVENYPEAPAQGDDVTIEAEVVDHAGVKWVYVWWRVNSGNWTSLWMDSAGSGYSANIGSFDSSNQVDYYIQSMDLLGTVRLSEVYSFVVI